MMKHFFFTIAIFFSLFQTSRGDDLISCAHLELCQIINRISLTKTENISFISGDAHEYEPSTIEIKKLLAAKVLIHGPYGLNPWIKKISYLRSKNDNLKTIPIHLDKSDYQFYPLGDEETLSHFWLYPKIYCSFQNKIEKNLNLPSKTPCAFKIIEDQLKTILAQIKKPIILTHNALLPLLLSLSAPNGPPIVALKGSGHHDEIKPAAIKKMIDLMNSSPVIWIQEEEVITPANILNKIRPVDIIIKLKTSKTLPDDPFSILNELSRKLSSSQEIR